VDSFPERGLRKGPAADGICVKGQTRLREAAAKRMGEAIWIFFWVRKRREFYKEYPHRKELFARAQSRNRAPGSTKPSTSPGQGRATLEIDLPLSKEKKKRRTKLLSSKGPTEIEQRTRMLG